MKPDGPMNSLWSRWFTVAERFDAVLWPTDLQRAEVEQRFGASTVHVVVPHAVPAAASVAPLSARDPGRVVMLNRLAPGSASTTLFARSRRWCAGSRAPPSTSTGKAPSAMRCRR